MSHRKADDKQFPSRNSSMKDKSKQYTFWSITAAYLFIGVDSKENKMIWVFCSSSYHRANDCNYAKILTPNEKNSVLERNSYCFNCFTRFHEARNCKER